MKQHSSTALINESFTLEPNNAHALANLCGHVDGYIRQIEQRLDVEINNRGNAFEVTGLAKQVTSSIAIIELLYSEAIRGIVLTAEHIHLCLQESGLEEFTRSKKESTIESGINVESPSNIRTRKSLIKPRGENQKHYVNQVRTHDINFGIGPAGTGKTYLAVACAVEALEREQIQRILLVRPAVEAGEKLGFLPGDLAQKIDPYLRPLYDALYEMLGFERVEKLIEKHVIEVAPLAYMRGRTLNNAFIILDESQNTTREQMKMFLTRIGFGSTAVITGDTTQIDLAKHIPSGLRHAMEVLEGVNGISFTHFLSKDVVRHPIVQRIVEAYEIQDKKEQTLEDKRHQEQARP